MKSTFSIALHGGAGTITRAMMSPEKESMYLSGLKGALEIGKSILIAGGSAMDAVEQTVIALENNNLFNAGKGAVFNHSGKHEMDAAIMEGRELKAGAVTCVSGLKNPIHAARLVMEKSEHVLLSGTGASEFAISHGATVESDDYFYDEFRFQQWREIANSDVFQLDHTEKKFGTVGAVAKDMHGNLAAATSTGGMTNKKWGRIGDSPVIGSGTYANNRTCAISCTGHGELFLRAVVAYDISCLMEYKGLSLHEACNVVVMDKLVKIGGEGGLVAVDFSGNICMPFNSEGMYRASSNQMEDSICIYK